jgi:energy-coupling factor transporter ATP-binding protein EcfA2
VPKRCEGASCPNRDSKTWHCTQCDCDYCDECWAQQGPHKPGKKGQSSHEKADLGVVQRYESMLTPPNDSREQREQHLEDQKSAWFGIVRDEHDKPMFFDYGTYSSIIADTTTVDCPTRYPQLVSFIGQTGAGKSTIVKMLIDQQVRKVDTTWQLVVPSPVVGSARHSHTPTSSDVHLYVDPFTRETQFPMLYVDCEGFGGGESTPFSAQMRDSSDEGGKKSHPYRRHGGISLLARGSQHILAWADSPEKQKRQYAVQELYPRLLYTFSDTIVFVLRNSK